jgi:PAS domain S-box-containing protein
MSVDPNRQAPPDALYEREARYRHLVENATDVIYTHDLTGRVLSVNKAGETLFGIARDEAVGMSIFDLVAPEFREQARAATAQKLQQGGSTTYTIDIITRAGRRVPLEVSTQIIYEAGEPVAIQGIGRDITERQRAAETLARRQRYFRALIENADDAITIINADGSIRYSSPAVERLTGFTPEEREGTPVFETIHPDDQASARSHFARLQDQPEEGVAATLRVQHRDGSWRFVRFRGRNLMADEAVHGIVVNWHDITEQVDAEQRLKRREQFFRSIIERSSDILAVVDAQQTIRYVSPAFQAITGHEPEQLIGSNGRHLLHPDDTDAVNELFSALFVRNEPTANAVLRGRDAQGNYRTYDVRVRNLLDNPAINGLIFDARDVTDSKRVEEALRTSEERFRKIVETSGEGIGIRDASGELTFVNERFAEMLGYDSNELIGINVFSLVAPEHRDLLLDSAGRRQHTGKSGQVDVEFVRKDGGRIAVILSSSPLYDHAGNFVGALGMLTDITERKQLEAQLRVSQKIEAVGRLAGGIAHDFNNLLTAIRGHVDLLLADVPADSPIRGDVQEIRRGADRAANLTQQLLAFSRKQILQPRVLEVDKVVTGMATLIRRLIGEDIRLETLLKSNDACVHADRGQLEQVIMNLAVNARDAMPRGGRLIVETHVVDIDEDFVRANAGSRAGRYVQLLVRDTGVGMSSETLSHVFEPFFTTKEVGRGTGLGLATVYGIVKQSGGYIRVQSEENVGTGFEILLPYVEATPEVVTEPQARSSMTARGETVLVAEDERAVRALASRILRKRGYHVLEATDGVEALEIARQHEGRIDLLLTDIVMPIMGGRELAEQLRSARPTSKVLFMSGYMDDALLQRGVEQGVGSLLEKPFTPDGLAAKVREVLESD